MTYTLCYTSRAKDNLSADELQIIFDTTVSWNSSKGINGALLYNSGLFLQVLEGDEQEVWSLYEKICADPRHTDIYCFIKKSSKTGFFKDYSAGFSVVLSQEECDRMNEYLQANHTYFEQKELSRILSNFLFLD